MFLRTDEMLEYSSVYEPLGIEDLVHVCHEECPAGTDKKKRLYIKRIDEAVLFFCHHCGSKGYLKMRDRLHRADEIGGVSKPMIPTPALLDALDGGLYTSDMKQWSKEARLWWYGYGFDQDAADKYGVQWDGRRLWLTGGEVWQGRAFGTDTPKYVTVRHPSPEPALFLGTGDKYVLVEDLLSTYRVQQAGYNALCLMGTKLQDKHLTSLLKHGNIAYVWLDDDEAGQTAAVTIVTTLKNFMPVTNICNRQPKEMSVEQIRSIIDA